MPARAEAMRGRPRSSPRRWKGRGALLAYGAGAFLHVLEAEAQHLEGERLVEDGPGLAPPVVERALGEPDRGLAAPGQRVGHGQGRFHELVGRNAATDKTDALGLATV